MEKPNEQDMASIKAALCQEYAEPEVDAMLKTAQFHKDEFGVRVIYDNGVVDRFLFVTCLVHESDLNPV